MLENAIIILKATESVPYRTKLGVQDSYYIFSVKGFNFTSENRMVIDYNVNIVNGNNQNISLISYENATIENVTNTDVLGKKMVDVFKEVVEYNFTNYAIENKIYGFEDFELLEVEENENI